MVLQDITRRQDNLVWNTDLIETVDLENPISQTAQRDDVQRMKHMISTVACRSEGGADKRGNIGLQGCIGF